MADLFDMEPKLAEKAKDELELAEALGAKVTPCTRPFTGEPSHRCRIGGGDAGYSDNGGRSWFCGAHRPRDFLPKDRR